MGVIRFFGQHKGAVALVMVLLLIKAGCELAIPVLTSQIVDVGIAQSGVEDVDALEGLKAAGVDLFPLQMAYLLRIGGFMLAFAAGSMALDVAVGYVSSRTGAKIGRSLRSRLFNRVVAFSDAEINQFSAASLITRGTNDVVLIQNVSTMLLRMVLYAPILAIGGVVMVMATNPELGWIVVVAVAVVFSVIAVLFRFTLPRFKIMQKLIDKVNLVAREMLTGLPVVRAFNREGYEEGRFDGASLKLMRTQLFTNRAMTAMMPAMMLVMNLTSVAIVWFGSAGVAAGSMQTGDLIAFITYAMVIIMGCLMMGMISIMLPRADVAVQRINEVLATEPSVQDPAPTPAGAMTTSDPISAGGDFGRASSSASIPPDEGGRASAPAEGVSRPSPARGARVVFDDVTFRYGDEGDPALSHVSFAAEPGQTLAIVGPTGSGKTTVVKLIERFFDANAGSVSVDGVDVRAMPQADLRAQFGYVPQKAFLFEGTVASNIAYGGAAVGGADGAGAAGECGEVGTAGEADGAGVSCAVGESGEAVSEDVIRGALSVACALDFVEAREGGLASPISQGGANVSGGQRQRLCIARALARKPRAYLFDDCFSALDYATDAKVRAALPGWTEGSTVILVAQRISTVLSADRIVVLDEGRVAGVGTHRELMETCPEYREIALSQLSEEELSGECVEGGAR
ncbi:ABC transporter ATP-binding protein [Adlercreutzia sp. R25]|uniref:ABC transporter ATP-binding protein n=1 Tax=Adlercreutzia shanghongiae TaxID=3111773 RepID=UPI002DB78372|nr:ABC transporter ATP-binding protein [Adlercreutzia sp. R25]MEC4272287.1 ABC transporter ATP-binding protein [Adlercreutzia sp. R25]